MNSKNYLFLYTTPKNAILYQSFRFIGLTRIEMSIGYLVNIILNEDLYNLSIYRFIFNPEFIPLMKNLSRLLSIFIIINTEMTQK